jgi:hypothetical protein
VTWVRRGSDYTFLVVSDWEDAIAFALFYVHELPLLSSAFGLRLHKRWLVENGVSHTARDYNLRFCHAEGNENF